MHALKKAKLSALKELIKKMHKMEVTGFTDKPRGPSTDEMAEEAEEEIEDEDVEMREPKKLAQGEIEGDEGNSEPVPGMKKYMKRSSSAPVKGKTKSVMLSMKPGKIKSGKT